MSWNKVFVLTLILFLVPSSVHAQQTEDWTLSPAEFTETVNEWSRSISQTAYQLCEASEDGLNLDPYATDSTRRVMAWNEVLSVADLEPDPGTVVTVEIPLADSSKDGWLREWSYEPNKQNLRFVYGLGPIQTSVPVAANAVSRPIFIENVRTEVHRHIDGAGSEVNGRAQGLTIYFTVGERTGPLANPDTAYLSSFRRQKESWFEATFAEVQRQADQEIEKSDIRKKYVEKEGRFGNPPQFEERKFSVEVRIPRSEARRLRLASPPEDAVLRIGLEVLEPMADPSSNGPCGSTVQTFRAEFRHLNLTIDGEVVVDQPVSTL